MSKYKKLVRCRKNGVVYEIEVEGIGEECEETKVIMNFIKNISCDKNVFVELCGEASSINKSAILSLVKDPKHSPLIKMEINPEKLNSINMLFENRYTYIYIFDHSMEWNNFIEMRKINPYFKKGKLIAMVSLFNLDSTWIKIRDNYDCYVKDLLERFQQKQYSIKMDCIKK